MMNSTNLETSRDLFYKLVESGVNPYAAIQTSTYAGQDAFDLAANLGYPPPKTVDSNG